MKWFKFLLRLVPIIYFSIRKHTQSVRIAENKTLLRFIAIYTHTHFFFFLMKNNFLLPFSLLFSSDSFTYFSYFIFPKWNRFTQTKEVESFSKRFSSLFLCVLYILFAPIVWLKKKLWEQSIIFFYFSRAKRINKRNCTLQLWHDVVFRVEWNWNKLCGFEKLMFFLFVVKICWYILRKFVKCCKPEMM